MNASVKKIYVDMTVRDHETTRIVLRRARSVPHELVDPSRFKANMDRFSISEGKRVLYITGATADVVRDCPGTSGPYLCCRYSVIDMLTQCPFDCSYCILQMYLDRPCLCLYVNLEAVIQEMEHRMQNEPGRYFRFGTGELSDSLALEPLTGISRKLALSLGHRRNGLLEFKTKSTAVSGMMDLPQSNVVVSWSLNPESIAKGEEEGAASVKRRLKAAERCAKNGLLLGFHFDPILYFPGWELAYRRLIDDLFARIDPGRIVWVSLGSLRFPLHLKRVAEIRHPKGRLFAEEMIRGQDGKMRYPRPLRVELYSRIAGWLKMKAPDLFVYFCMESPSVWTDVLGRCPRSNQELDFWFAHHLFQNFPELEMLPPQPDAYGIAHPQSR